jgi:hypothetical protein
MLRQGIYHDHSWTDGTTPAQQAEILQAASDLMAPFRTLAPLNISGQYLNEVIFSFESTILKFILTDDCAARPTCPRLPSL